VLKTSLAARTATAEMIMNQARQSVRVLLDFQERMPYGLFVGRSVRNIYGAYGVSLMESSQCTW
jgi:hypothetical protein